MLVKFVLSGLDCHWIVPVLPEMLSVLLFTPVHTEALPLITPATERLSTAITAVLLVTDEHTPLVTTAL
jgi:hypothetical protein